jgi:hypothetical protein
MNLRIACKIQRYHWNTYSKAQRRVKSQRRAKRVAGWRHKVIRTRR